MSETLELRIKQLERDLAVKNAYLSVNFVFPKKSSLPADVKEQVFNKLVELARQLAENQEILSGSTASEFTKEEVETLKMFAAAAKKPASSNIQGENVNAKSGGTLQNKSTTPSTPVDREAMLLTLENVPIAIRNKMSSEEKVLVKSEKEGKAFIINQNHQGFYIPLDDLQLL